MENIKIDTHLTDEQLVSEIIETKSSEYFSIIYDRYSQKIYGKCLSFVKNREEAQDLTHDIFVKLFVKIKTFNHKSKFSTWLYSFTYNHCVNYVQRELNKRRDKFLSSDNENDYKDLDTRQEEISDELIFKMESDKLTKSLTLIDPSDKSILFMKYQDDMTIEEIQNALDLGKSAVKMRLSRAKSRLVKVYESI